ncbi:type II toxin-antitoxin system VapC family toxin [Thermodesulfobacteriota bacterium]
MKAASDWLNLAAPKKIYIPFQDEDPPQTTMVLVDTSIWVAHLRQGSRQLEKLLMDAGVMCHPFIIGELACGNLKNRNEITSLLQSLPTAPTIEFDEFLFFIDENHLMGKGIGFVDVHVLASAQLAGITLWTADKKLKFVADQLKLTFK